MNKTGPLCSMVEDIYGSCLRHSLVMLLVCPGVAPFAIAQGFTPGYKMFRTYGTHIGVLYVCSGNSPFAITQGFTPGYKMFGAYGTHIGVLYVCSGISPFAIAQGFTPGYMMYRAYGTYWWVGRLQRIYGLVFFINCNNKLNPVSPS